MNISRLYDPKTTMYVVTIEFECSGNELEQIAKAPLSLSVAAFRQFFGQRASLSQLTYLRQYFQKGK